MRYVIENMWPKIRDISPFCSGTYSQIDAALDGMILYITIRYALLSTEEHLYPPALLISVPVHDTLVKKRRTPSIIRRALEK